jgi:hypothetical protein
MVANSYTVVIYCGILPIDNIGTAVNYCCIFITLAQCVATFSKVVVLFCKTEVGEINNDDGLEEVWGRSHKTFLP